MKLGIFISNMRFSLIGFVLLFAISCKKKGDYVHTPVQIDCALSRNLDTAKMYIQGSWQHLEDKNYTWGQQGPIYTTPNSLGFQITLKLNNDTARFFKDNTPADVYTYKVLWKGDITGFNFPEDSLPVLAYYEIPGGMRNSYVPIEICGKYLVLHYQYVTSNSGRRIMRKQ